MTQEEKRLTGLEEEIIRFNMVNRPINHSELGLKQWGEMVARHFYELGKQSDYSEIPADLEEAANHHICKAVDAVKRRGWELETQDIADAFIAGYNLCREQMLKEAVEAIVEDWNPDPEPEITIPLNPEEFTCGDKVRVIVCKKED